jgi:hypothetical protein
VAAKIVHDDDVTGLHSREQNLLDADCEALTVDRAIENPRRLDPIVAQAARKVVVFLWPCGTLAVNLVPRGAQPCKVAMLVLVQVSSMNTRRGSTRPSYFVHCAPAGDVRTVAFASDDVFLAQTLGVDEIPHRPVIDFRPALGEFGDQPAQG